MEPEMTWEWWAGNAEDTAVSVAGRPTFDWAIDVIRSFFGETWLGNNASRTGYVPLLGHLWWPPRNFRVVTRILELAARIALVTGNRANSDLTGEAQTIYSSRELAGTKFEHLCLTLEVAAFAVLAGWSVSYEEPSAAGRRPDLTITRNSVSYTVELTRLGLDREFRAIERYCGELKSRLQQLERQHEVELVCRSAEVLSEKDLAVWLAEIGQACERSAVDGQTRTVARNGSETSTFPAGQRPAGRVFTGPSLLAMYGVELPHGSARRPSKQPAEPHGCGSTTPVRSCDSPTEAPSHCTAFSPISSSTSPPPLPTRHMSAD
jgi:hypothetical protein